MEIINLSEKELLDIYGGESLWDRATKSLEDAGQYVGGFFYGLFVGECPEEC